MLYLLAACVSMATADVIVVDASGGPGADFLSIQPAVDFASNGDTVLVHTGTYLGFGLHAKGISVVASAGAQVDLTSEITVRNLPGDAQVTLKGLDVVPVSLGQRGLVASHNTGAVWVEDCHLRGSTASYLGNYDVAVAEPGVLAVDCDHLALLGCVLVGGDGLDYGESSQYFWGPLSGAAGVGAQGSHVYVFGGRLRGGIGGSNDDSGGANGGHGVELSNEPASFCFLEGTRLIGGSGGAGGWSGGLGTDCGDGGSGGSCIYAPSLATAYVRDSVFIPGNGGPAGSSYCNPGGDGQPFSPPGNMVLPLTGTARTMGIESPVFQGGTALLEAQGLPGDLIWAQVGLDLDPAYLPAIEGLRLIGLPRRLLFLGVAAGDGSFSMQMTMPPLSNPMASFSTHIQGYFRDMSGLGHLGSGAHLLVLGSGY